MRHDQIVAAIKSIGVVPVVRTSSAESAIQAIHAVYRGGIRAAEVTMTVPGAVKALEKLADELIAANPKQVEQYRAGKKTMLGFFVGQVMKASKGQANPQLVNEVLTRKLES